MKRLTLITAAVTLAALLLVPAAQGAPPLLKQFCKGAQGEPQIGEAGHCFIPRGMAVNPTTGNLYVADQANNRIQEFSAWGSFLRAWGWDVVASGPDDTVANEFEICDAEAHPADVCQTGSEGGGFGQFGPVTGPQGVAVDPQSGDVYVVDRNNHRVEKFDAEGHPLLMFGGDVDQGPNHPGNLCTAAFIAQGDTCGAAAAGNPGPGEGQFGGWPVASFIAVAPDRSVYVGDQERIQLFNPDGSFKSQIALPGKGFVAGLAVSPGGDVFASFASGTFGLEAKPNVLKLGPAGETLCTIEAAQPKAIATGEAGNAYVIDGNTVRQFNSSCAEIPGFAFNTPIESSTGIAASNACGIAGTDLFVSNFSGFEQVGFINLYGPHPDPTLCPPPSVPPSIDAQFATAADSAGATLKAKINPHFWPDTRYYVQYGTGKCSEGDCTTEKPLFPGALLGKEAIDADLATADVFLEGLQANTTYHYRFVAESGGGGPVLGVGGTEAEAGKESSFHTLPVGSEPNTSCPNQAFRSGPSAKLPDCRAYELVSPLDKNNGDVAINPDPSQGGRASFFQAATDGRRMTFSSIRAFPGAEGSWLSNQYLAKRQEGLGWSTRAISPPRDTRSFYPTIGSAAIPFNAFSPSLCGGWVVGANEVPFALGAPAGVPNLYRRDLCGGGSYELLTATPPPGFGGASESNYFPEIQGFSADEAHSVFRADAALAVSAGDPVVPLHCETESKAKTISYAWLRDGAPIPGATATTYTPGPEDAGMALQCQVRASGTEGASTEASKPQQIAPVPAITPPAIPRAGNEVAENRHLMVKGATLSGTPLSGETLTCTPGPWSGSPTFTYQWLKGATPIPGATEPTYTVAPADKGTAIQCELSATNAGGAALADSAAQLIGARSPSPSAAPAISGTAAVGETLSCSPGAWSNSPTFTYQWLRGGEAIATATASTYTLQAADEEKAIQCRVLAATADASALGVSAATVISPQPATAPPAQSAPGSLKGTAKVGETLTCEAGTWSGSPSFARKWLRNGVVLGGVTTETYELGNGDRGKALQCQITATNAGASVIALDPPRYVDPAPPAAPDVSAYSVYEVYESSPGAALHLVSVLPDGSPAAGHSSVGTAQGQEGSSTEDSVHNAVSADGSRVFWTATEDSYRPTIAHGGSGDQAGRLYLRLNATQPQSEVSGGQCTEAEAACTIAVSASPQTRFIAANPQGTRVLYTVGKGGIDLNQNNEELFEADIEEAAGQMVATPHLIATGVKGVMGASEDVRRVYFVSSEALSGSQANAKGEQAQAGAPNLYFHESGSGFVFVGALSTRDLLATSNGGGPPSPIAVLPYKRSSRVAPDGLSAAFISVAQLTGYDNTDVTSGEADGEAFRFDAGSGQLSCLSCRSSGARPRGREVGAVNNGALQIWAAAQIPGWLSQTDPGSALSDNGNRLFFNSYDALAPGDTNGHEDVYEWEAPGEGDCTEESTAFSEANEGCLYLITSGQSPEDSELFDATPDGSNVFFATQSSLLVQDYGLRDVYDARVNGGFPAPAGQPAGCEGEACQGTPAAPNDPTPASSSFEGAGNVTEPTAKKKRQHKKAKKQKHRHRAKKSHGRANHNRRNGR
jgi:DNA-binding beta-propeller fold protein YncE